MGLSRRALIKQAGAAAAALGLMDLAAELALNQAGLKIKGLPVQPSAYGSAIAATSGRKLALLIGVDKYATGALSADQGQRLAGCVTDVALQKELLVHRFGFLPKDIVCLTNEQATRTGIYDAFISHLYNQAKAGDVVVVHFSGYGAQVRIENLAGEPKTVRSLVPYDGLLPSEAFPALNDITEIELKTLLKQLKTKNITTVLDAGFVDNSVALSGGLRSRSRSAIATGEPPVAFPLLATTPLASEREAFPGVLLRAADLGDIVIERQWHNFNAGAFTYVLSQYLWSANPAVTVSQALGQSQEVFSRWGSSQQQPNSNSRSGQSSDNRSDQNFSDSRSDQTSGSTSLLASGNRAQGLNSLMYYTPVITSARGEGVIQSVSADGKTATIWLGGMPSRVLEYLAPPAILTCAGRRLKLRSHNGLIAKAKLIEDASNTDLNSAPLQVGQPVFEAIRVLPKSIDLVVALDNRLERIERVDATSALSALSFVSSTSDTDLPADCLLSKPLTNSPETLTASLRPIKPPSPDKSAPDKSAPDKSAPDKSAPDPLTGLPAKSKPPEAPSNEVKSGYGLFSLTRSLIPGTLALQDEAIKPAINRLSAKLRSLTALKMLRLSENSSASQLPVRVTLELVGAEESLLISRQTLRPQTFKADPDSDFIPEVPVGSRIRYRLFNGGAVPLFYTLINVDPRERLSAFCPMMGSSAQPLPAVAEDASEKANRAIAAASIPPGSSVAIPSIDLDWSVEVPTGPVETYVVCSTSPLTHTFKTLLSATVISGKQRVSPLPNPLEVVEALLADISQGNETDAYTLNVNQWATLNFTYQAV